MDEEDKVLTVVIDGFVSRFVGWLRSLYYILIHGKPIG